MAARARQNQRIAQREPGEIFGQQRLAGEERGEGGDGTLLRGATNRELADHDGQAHQHHTQQVDEAEGRATIHSCDERKTPDVAQTDGRAGDGEDEADFRTPVFA